MCLMGARIAERHLRFSDRRGVHPLCGYLSILFRGIAGAAQTRTGSRPSSSCLVLSLDHPAGAVGLRCVSVRLDGWRFATQHVYRDPHPTQLRSRYPDDPQEQRSDSAAGEMIEHGKQDQESVGW